MGQGNLNTNSDKVENFAKTFDSSQNNSLFVECSKLLNCVVSVKWVKSKNIGYWQKYEDVNPTGMNIETWGILVDVGNQCIAVAQNYSEEDNMGNFSAEVSNIEIIPINSIKHIQQINYEERDEEDTVEEECVPHDESTKEFTVTIDDGLTVEEIRASDNEWEIVDDWCDYSNHTYIAKDWSDYSKDTDKDNVQFFDETIVNLGEEKMFNSKTFKIVAQPHTEDEKPPKFTVICNENDLLFEFSAEDGTLLKTYRKKKNDPLLEEYRWGSKFVADFDVWEEYCVNNIPKWLDRTNPREASLTNKEFIKKVWRGENPFQQ